jgi:hypothetical protein
MDNKPPKTSPEPEPSRHRLGDASPLERVRLLRSWLLRLPPVPSIPLQALRRENLY